MDRGGQTMTGRPSIVEFLRARLEDEEQVAREVPEKNWYRATWVGDEFNSAVVITRDVTLASGSDHSIAQCGVEALEDGEVHAEHIARWDPARVLAEVALKRYLLLWCERSLFDGDGEPWHDNGWDPSIVAAKWMLSSMAALYVDHPDYDPAWALETVET
jgi:hypothetical protein